MSFVQVQAGVASRRKLALATIREAQRQATGSDKPGLELLALAFAGAHGKDGNQRLFAQV